jgi:nuclear pore complex protein Nup205
MGNAGFGRWVLTAPGKIKIGDDEYEVNEDFKLQTLELSEALNLDELDAAALFLGAESEAQELDRSQIQTAVIRFHRRREYVLLCLRILVKTALDGGDSEVLGLEHLQMAVQIIVGVHETTNLSNAYGFWIKCLTTMDSIEKWLHVISERVNNTQVLRGDHDFPATKSDKATREPGCDMHAHD